MILQDKSIFYNLQLYSSKIYIFSCIKYLFDFILFMFKSIAIYYIKLYNNFIYIVLIVSMYTIHTQWSSDNLTLQRLIEQHIRQQIKEQRQDTRYRCLAFYFFEKEITSDIYESVITQSLSVEQLLSNPEYQALMARHASSEQ